MANAFEKDLEDLKAAATAPIEDFEAERLHRKQRLAAVDSLSGLFSVLSKCRPGEEVLIQKKNVSLS